MTSTKTKIIAIDYGIKRTGYAISDETKTFAFGLSTQDTKNNFQYLKEIFTKETIELIVVGLPKTLTNELATIVPEINLFIQHLQQQYPQLRIISYDERFTSKMAQQSMLASGLKKKDRQNKHTVDKVAATILLQNYLAYAYKNL